VRSPFVLFGAAIAILGYGVVYNGLSNIIHSAAFPHGPVGILDSLIPGHAKGQLTPTSPRRPARTEARSAAPLGGTVRSRPRSILTQRRRSEWAFSPHGLGPR
jgi:hypothetical protein